MDGVPAHGGSTSRTKSLSKRKERYRPPSKTKKGKAGSKPPARVRRMAQESSVERSVSPTDSIDSTTASIGSGVSNHTGEDSSRMTPASAGREVNSTSSSRTSTPANMTTHTTGASGATAANDTLGSSASSGSTLDDADETLDAGGPMPEYQYTKDELIGLRECNAAQNRPEFLEIEFCNADGFWDPDLWCRSFDLSREVIKDRKRAGDLNRPRTLDPKQRVRDEGDDAVVLSPQRRSFLTGCHVNNSAGGGGGSSSQSGGSHQQGDGERDKREHGGGVGPGGGRRIGSGRIAMDRQDGGGRGDWGPTGDDRPPPRDFRGLVGMRDRESREGGRGGDRDRDYDDRRFGNDRYQPASRRDLRGEPRGGLRGDLRSSRDSRDRLGGRDRDRDMGFGRSKGYGRDRDMGRYHQREEEEPEWFSEDVEQGDTIELHGFEDRHPNRDKQKSERASGRKSPAGEKSRSSTPSSEQQQDKDSKSAETKADAAAIASTEGESEAAVPGKKFDFNDFISATAAIPGLQDPVEGGVFGGDHILAALGLASGASTSGGNASDSTKGADTSSQSSSVDATSSVSGGGAAPGGGSRFSRWFSSSASVADATPTTDTAVPASDAQLHANAQDIRFLQELIGRGSPPPDHGINTTHHPQKPPSPSQFALNQQAQDTAGSNLMHLLNNASHQQATNTYSSVNGSSVNNTNNAVTAAATLRQPHHAVVPNAASETTDQQLSRMLSHLNAKPSSSLPASSSHHGSLISHSSLDDTIASSLAARRLAHPQHQPLSQQRSISPPDKQQLERLMMLQKLQQQQNQPQSAMYRSSHSPPLLDGQIAASAAGLALPPRTGLVAAGLPPPSLLGHKMMSVAELEAGLGGSNAAAIGAGRAPGAAATSANSLIQQQIHKQSVHQQQQRHLHAAMQRHNVSLPNTSAPPPQQQPSLAGLPIAGSGGASGPTGEMSQFNKLLGMMKDNGQLKDPLPDMPIITTAGATSTTNTAAAAQHHQLAQHQQSQQQQHAAALAAAQRIKDQQHAGNLMKLLAPLPPSSTAGGAGAPPAGGVSPLPTMTLQPPGAKHPAPTAASPTPQPPTLNAATSSSSSGAGLMPPAPSSPRAAASPIMFGSQPPLHLTAPSPIHAVGSTGTSQSTSPNTLQVNPQISRVPSPAELRIHTQRIMQNALIKKQLEEQKERFIKKQQDRGKSPNPLIGMDGVAPLGSVEAPASHVQQPPSAQQQPPAAATAQTLQHNMQPPPAMQHAQQQVMQHHQQQQQQTSSGFNRAGSGGGGAMAAFTPTSVMRKMATDKVTNKSGALGANNHDSNHVVGSAANSTGGGSGDVVLSLADQLVKLNTTQDGTAALAPAGSTAPRALFGKGTMQSGGGAGGVSAAAPGGIPASMAVPTSTNTAMLPGGRAIIKGQGKVATLPVGGIGGGGFVNTSIPPPTVPPPAASAAPVVVGGGLGSPGAPASPAKSTLPPHNLAHHPNMDIMALLAANNHKLPPPTSPGLSRRSAAAATATSIAGGGGGGGLPMPIQGGGGGGVAAIQAAAAQRMQQQQQQILLHQQLQAARQAGVPINAASIAALQHQQQQKHHKALQQQQQQRRALHGQGSGAVAGIGMTAGSPPYNAAPNANSNKQHLQPHNMHQQQHQLPAALLHAAAQHNHTGAPSAGSAGGPQHQQETSGTGGWGLPPPPTDGGEQQRADHLSKWFGPGVMKQSLEGAMPLLPSNATGQAMMTLDEIEQQQRQQQTVSN